MEEWSDGVMSIEKVGPPAERIGKRFLAASNGMQWLGKGVGPAGAELPPFVGEPVYSPIECGEELEKLSHAGSTFRRSAAESGVLTLHRFCQATRPAMTATPAQIKYGSGR